MSLLPSLQLWRLAAELVELVLGEYTLPQSEGLQAGPAVYEEFQKESRLLIEPFGEPRVPARSSLHHPQV